MIQAAQQYENPGDLAVIVCLFNIQRGNAKAANFQVCRKLYEGSSIPLTTIECAFNDAPWALEPRKDLIQVRAAATLWQKERLINAALSRVDPRYTKVAWIDADILFENARWAVEASERLNTTMVVQLADGFIRLPRGAGSYSGSGEVWESFAAVQAREPNALLQGDFGAHGHPGFAWAARRSLLEQAGLYDACITGGGDHVMAHAFCGDWESPCLDRMLGSASAWRRHARAWAVQVYPLVQARVGFVAGRALHLWHGEIASRQHIRRYRPLWAADFDPDSDIELSGNGCWSWRSASPSMRRGVECYAHARATETLAISEVHLNV